jgi:hypothetical protein
MEELAVVVVSPDIIDCTIAVDGNEPHRRPPKKPEQQRSTKATSHPKHQGLADRREATRAPKIGR